MKAICLLILNGILHIALSQVDITDWAELNVEFPIDAPPAAVVGHDCNQIGAYDPIADDIKIFGGEAPMGAYTFDPVTETWKSNDTSALTTGISVENTAWIPYGDDTIFYESSGVIRSININSQVDTVFATLDATKSQQQPGLCVNESSGTVYSVGNRQIETCTASGCTVETQDALVLVEGGEDELIAMACVVYGSSVFTFGGLQAAGQQFPTNKVFECDPAIQDSCAVVPGDQLSTVAGRGNIRAVRFECFNDQYVALFGGTSNEAGESTSRVEIYDMEAQTATSEAPFTSDKRGSVIVFDTRREQFWLFGGTDTANSCSGDIERTDMPQGVCFTPDPTMDPTIDPTFDPTADPTTDPTNDPTSDPTMDPTSDPTTEPTTGAPTLEPTPAPTDAPQTSTSSSTSSTTTTTQVPFMPSEDGEGTSGSAYGVVIGLFIAICCIIVICAIWYSKEEKDHAYGMMAGGAAGGGAVAMAPVVVASGYEKPEYGQSGAAAGGGYSGGANTGSSYASGGASGGSGGTY